MSKWDAAQINAMIAQGKSVEEIANEFGVSRKTAVNRLGELRIKPNQTQSADRETPKGAEYVQRNQDGTYISEKPIWMSLENITDAEYLLKEHGFDPSNWELVTFRNNKWNAYSKQDGIMTLYASKITVKPRSNGISFDDFVEAIKAEVEPVHIESIPVPAEYDRLLEVSLFDMHFGNSDFEYYKETQQEIIDLINSHPWREVLFLIGQDLLHHDNFKSSTSNGTVIANADMKRAVKDAKSFYYPLIDVAAKQSNNNVYIKYSKGNHDESMSYMFVQVLMERYPDLKFDDDIRERKVHVYHKNFIGFTHGDKARNVLRQLFTAEFPIEWSQTTCREIHAGDLHREDTKGYDEFGVMFRTLSTKNKTDQWHEDKGFTTAHKRFMLFEYSPEALKSIYYV